ncbi:hypothetical protein ACQKMN_17000 [Ureibacillus composti]
MQITTHEELIRTEIEVIILFLELLKHIGADKELIVEITSKPTIDLKHFMNLLNNEIERKKSVALT